MANSLNMDLTNQYVVLDPRFYNEPFIVKCQEGFGVMPFTSGTCVSALFLKDQSTSRIEGTQILRLATKEEIESKEINEKDLLTLLEDSVKQFDALVKGIEDLLSRSREILRTTKSLADLVEFLENFCLDCKTLDTQLTEEDQAMITEIIKDRSKAYRKLMQLKVAISKGTSMVYHVISPICECEGIKNGLKKADEEIYNLYENLKPLLELIKKA